MCKIIGWRFRVTWQPMWLIASPNGTFSYLRARYDIIKEIIIKRAFKWRLFYRQGSGMKPLTLQPQSAVPNVSFLFFDPTGYVMGENLFYSQQLYSWDVVISTWHNEVSHFKYPNVSTTGQPIGHYTQVTDSDNVSTKITDVLSRFTGKLWGDLVHTMSRNTKALAWYQRLLCFPPGGMWCVLGGHDVVQFLSWEVAIISTVSRSYLSKQNCKLFY